MDTTVRSGYDAARPQLADLCRSHDIASDLIDRCHDLDGLLCAVIEEYQRRLDSKALVQFASQATAIHEKAEAAEVLRVLGALSHQINNPLTALLGRAQILQSRPGTDPAVVKAAHVIEQSAQRVADLIRELAQVVKNGRR
jgi:signal transduction histidine kinase